MRTLLMMASLATAVGIGSAAFAADAPAQKADKRPADSCFLASNVNGFSRVDDKTVDVTVGAHDVYRLTLFSPAPHIDWSMRIALVSRGGSWICSPLDATVVAPSGIGPQRYPVTAIHKLTSAELAARKARS